MDSSYKVCCLEPYLALRPHTSVCLNHFKLMFPKRWWSDWGNSFVSRPLMGDQRLFPSFMLRHNVLHLVHVVLKKRMSSETGNPQQERNHQCPENCETFLPQTKPLKVSLSSAVCRSWLFPLCVCVCQTESCLPDLFDTSEDESDSLGGCFLSLVSLPIRLEITDAETFTHDAHTGLLYAHTHTSAVTFPFLSSLSKPLFTSLKSFPTSGPPFLSHMVFHLSRFVCVVFLFFFYSLLPPSNPVLPSSLLTTPLWLPFP